MLWHCGSEETTAAERHCKSGCSSSVDGGILITQIHLMNVIDWKLRYLTGGHSTRQEGPPLLMSRVLPSLPHAAIFSFHHRAPADPVTELAIAVTGLGGPLLPASAEYYTSLASGPDLCWSNRRHGRIETATSLNSKARDHKR